MGNKLDRRRRWKGKKSGLELITEAFRNQPFLVNSVISMVVVKETNIILFI